jgi:hypothetical protein
MDDICAGATIILYDLFSRLHNISDLVTKPFRLVGGCILPPNKLVIKYVSAFSPQNQSDEEKKEKGAVKATIPIPMRQTVEGLKSVLSGSVSLTWAHRQYHQSKSDVEAQVVREGNHVRLIDDKEKKEGGVK